MGTRGAFGWRLNNQDYITYNHFDSYPDELGATMIKFISENSDLQVMREKVAALRLVNDDTKPTAEEQTALKKYSDDRVGAGSLADWYCLLRQTQGEPNLVLESGYILDFHDFLEDTTYCEYSYIINLDANTFEFYTGGIRSFVAAFSLSIIIETVTNNPKAWESWTHLMNQLSNGQLEISETE